MNLNLTAFLTLFFGLATVLQSGLNKEIAKSFGLPGAAWINSLVILSLSSIVLICAKSQILPEHPLLFHKGNWAMPPWWAFVPGLLGLVLVLGLPFSFMTWGAFATVVGMITGQLIFGLLWDVAIEKRALEVQQMIGAALTIAGVILVHLKK